MHRVTPNLSYVPVRTYTYEKGVITCHAVLSSRVGAIDSTVNEGEVLFTLQLPAKQAKMLMEDLYYGEYTGA